MDDTSIQFSLEVEEMHAGASEHAERAEVLAMLAREDEQAEGWKMLGIERE